jgi:hypothetical protein
MSHSGSGVSLPRLSDASTPLGPTISRSSFSLSSRGQDMRLTAFRKIAQEIIFYYSYTTRICISLYFFEKNFFQKKRASRS